MADCTDHIHFLRPTGGQLATKRFQIAPNGRILKSGFSQAARFHVETFSLTGIQDVHSLLTRKEHDPHSFAIRGKLKPELGLIPGKHIVNRRIHDRTSRDGQKFPAHWQEAPRRWSTLDIEELVPPPMTDPTDDPEGVVEWVLSRLPEPFQNASCHWAFSSSQNIPIGRHPDDPAPNEIRLHLTFWMNRQVSNAEWKTYIKRIAPTFRGADGKQARIDKALFNPVQPHYTAAPIFGHGLRDPLPRRSGFREGEVDEVTLPKSETDPPPPQPNHSHNGYTARGFESHLAKMGDGQDLGGFHDPIIRAIASYIGLHGADGTDPEWLKDQVREAIDHAPVRISRPPSDLQRYSSDRFLDDAIRGAIAKYGHDGKPNRGKQTAGVDPYWTGAELPHQWARNQLGKVANKRLAEATLWNQAQAERTIRKEKALAQWHQDNPEKELSNGAKASISKKANTAIREEFGFEDLLHAPRVQIQATASIGKTRAVIDAISAWEGPVFYYVPQLSLAAELVDRLQKNGLTVQKIEGRKDPICKKPMACRRAAMLRINVFETMCACFGTNERVSQDGWFATIFAVANI